MAEAAKTVKPHTALNWLEMNSPGKSLTPLPFVEKSMSMLPY
jgi:hypothetical protein